MDEHNISRLPLGEALLAAVSQSLDSNNTPSVQICGNFLLTLTNACHPSPVTDDMFIQAQRILEEDAGLNICTDPKCIVFILTSNVILELEGRPQVSTIYHGLHSGAASIDSKICLRMLIAEVALPFYIRAGSATSAVPRTRPQQLPAIRMVDQFAADVSTVQSRSSGFISTQLET
ncbi:hypothetical protein EMPG_15918 [Blastomyces silverae]|uniref:Uncharacterized protein n=1 Tax=Blastomyces silverae TaxID=2060906 RepID=A0A0H1BAZ8_9EURO|nr:hypothetical protein EMPG_15918 [Blastomyces silverae]